MSITVCWGSIRNRDCILYPDAGMFVLIRPTQTFYERITLALRRNDPTVIRFFSDRIHREPLCFISTIQCSPEGERLTYPTAYPPFH